MKHYLLEREPRIAAHVVGKSVSTARETLRWFYRAASLAASTRQSGPPAAPAARAGERENSYPQEASVLGVTRPTTNSWAHNERPANGGPAPAARRSSQPPAAAADTGKTPGERDLIKASRERGFLWRTEQTYREWAARFAEFLSPLSPDAAGGKEVAAFLSSLAVNQRASRSTQKQALNALVFLMQHALHRNLGEMEFRRAQRREKIPTVLSQEECLQLFAGMTGTPRLMAELMYGGGLRLLELLRLRVHHLDLSRGRIQVFAGKGDKDRVYGCADAVPVI